MPNDDDRTQTYLITQQHQHFSNIMTSTSTRDVLLFIPNLIGYVRVVMSLASFMCMVYMEDQVVLALSLYVGSFVGDLFDGMAARRFHQSSYFGGMLDMITDRCSTAGLLLILASKSSNPALVATLVCLLVLDMSSHWAQMVMSLHLGQHHKSVSANANRFFLVRWYYDCYPFFGYLCVAAEFTYVFLYALLVLKDTSSISPIINILHKAMYVVAPGCAMKNIVNVAQLGSACYAIAENDAIKRNKGHI